MKEYPILFSAPMVRALLAGTKTQTRRIVKPNVAEAIEFLGGGPSGEPATADDITLRWSETYEDSEERKVAAPPQWCVVSAEYPEEGQIPVGYAYGNVGDRLWVRETWANIALSGYPPVYFYRADGAELPPRDARAEHSAWRPSIHMPRLASRITLEVTGVRVERLQAISGPDASAEGVRIPVSARGSPLLRITGAIAPDAFKRGPLDEWTPDDFLRFEFAELWERIHGARSWAANPWVWAVTFAVVAK